MKDFSDLFIQSSPVFLVIVAPDGTVMTMSDSLLGALGYTLAEVTGQPFIDRFVAEGSRRQIRRFFTESGETGRSVSGEIRFLTRSGGIIPAEWQVQAMFRDGGDTDFVFCAGLNLTERKRMEDELMREREEQLRIFDSVPSIIFYKNRKNRYIRVNRAFSNLLGIPKKRIEGAAMSTVLPDIAEKSGRDDLEVITTGCPKRSILEIVETPDGPRWLQTDKFPLRDEEGKIIGILGTGMDITEPRGAEEAIHTLLDGAGGGETDFFERMTNRIQGWLETDFVLVLQIKDDMQAEVLAMWDGGNVVPSSCFRIEDTLFAEVFNAGYICRAEGAGKYSPATEAVLRTHVEGFVGTVVRGRNGKPIGCICAVSRNRLHPPRRTEELLRIFAAKAALEMERTRSQAALRESEERYRSLVETSPDAIVMTDPDGTIVTVNQQFAHLVGGDVGEILSSGRKAFGYLAHEDLRWAVRNVWQLLAGGAGRMSVECTICRLDGSTFPAEISMSLIRDECGIPGNFIGIIRDITGRRDAELRLHEEHILLESRLRNERMLSEIASLIASAETMESVLGGVVEIIRQTLSLDRVAIIRCENPEYSFGLNDETQTGGLPHVVFCRSQVLHKAVRGRRFFASSDFSGFEPEVREVLSSAGIRSIALFPLGTEQSLKGAVLLCQNHLWEPKPDEADLFGIIADMIASALERDMNFRARLDAERRHAEAVKMAERTTRLAAVGTLAAGISHEINQPLTALKVKVDSILYWKELNGIIPQEDLEENLRFLSQQAERIDDIIRHMRALARQEQGREPGDANLNEVIGDVLPLLRQRISAHGISIAQELDGDLPALRGYRTLLQQVIINLIVNAINAHDEHDRSDKFIHIATWHDDQTCFLRVTDNGPGIPDEILGRIFDPFFTTKVGTEGMGLGLSICHNIIAGIGGVISARNLPEGGAEFLVSVPMTHAGEDGK